MRNSVYRLPSRAMIEDEASAWLIKLDGDTPLSAAERQALREWLLRSPRHREELNDLAAFWGRMNILTELAVPLGNPETEPRRGVVAAAQRLLSSFGRAGVVAAVVVLGVAVAMTTWLRPDTFTASNGLYTTAVGQQQTTTLVDGTVIQLNTNSRVVVTYTDQYRNLHLLRGEAHFSVASNPQRPFRVYAGSGRIQAVGTAFAVHLINQDVQITVTEGRVVLASLDGINTAAPQPGSDTRPVIFRDSRDRDDEPVENLSTLEAGQSTVFKRRVIKDAVAETSLDVIQTIDRQELARRLSWRQGLLVFTGEPLREVVDEISRYTDASIDIADPEVGAIKIGGQFRIGETQAMFDALEENFGLHLIPVGENRVRLAAAESR